MCKDVSVAELPEKLSFLVQCSEVVGMEKTLIVTEDPEEGWLCLSSLTHGNFMQCAFMWHLKNHLK